VLLTCSREGFAGYLHFPLNQSVPARDQALRNKHGPSRRTSMLTASRNVILAAIAVSVLAGCQTAPPRECDKLKPNVTYNGKCCGVGDANCHEGKNGDKHDNRPDPRPQ
jgi:hypothetical protein